MDIFSAPSSWFKTFDGKDLLSARQAGRIVVPGVVYGLQSEAWKAIYGGKKGDYRQTKNVLIADMGTLRDLAAARQAIEGHALYLSKDNAEELARRLDEHKQEVALRSNYRAETWYGTIDRNYIVSVKRAYPRMSWATDLLDRVTSRLEINPETDVPRPKTHYTARPNGVFTFARAAPTLHAYPCYVNPAEENAECVPLNNVVRQGSTAYLRGTDIELERRGVEMRQDGSGGKWRTSARKIYAVKKKVNKVVPYIHIYIGIACSAGIEAGAYVYNSIAAVAVAKLLIDAGFKVAITGVSITLKATTSGDTSVLTYRIKDYDDAFDLNAALIYGGDPAFFRYDVFADIMRLPASVGIQATQSLGMPIMREYHLEEYLERLRLYETLNETRVTIAGRYSEYAAIDCVRSKIAELKILYGEQ